MSDAKRKARQWGYSVHMCKDVPVLANVQKLVYSIVLRMICSVNSRGARQPQYCWHLVSQPYIRLAILTCRIMTLSASWVALPVPNTDDRVSSVLSSSLRGCITKVIWTPRSVANMRSLCTDCNHRVIPISDTCKACAPTATTVATICETFQF